MGAAERTELTEPGSQRLLPQHVKRAVAYLRDNMADRITLADLTSACGVSERTLLKQFQTFLGIAPLAYLRRLRLNAVRNELAKRGNDNPIADIALGCGFSHLGRFAAEYRRLFGETPSATRRRANPGANGAVTHRNGELPATPALERDKPELLILPLCTETLQESLAARDLSERLAATLSRMRIVAVTLAHPSRSRPMNAPRPRNAGTQYCLLGRLTQCGERLRVVIRLVDVAADRHVWGDCFDGLANDPFQLEDRVVEGVLCGIASHLMDERIARAECRDPALLGARDLALQAMRLMLNTNLPSTRKAIDVLARVVEMDPGDPLPMALLAYCHAQRVGYLDTASPAVACEMAQNYYRRAGALENNDPLAMIARASTASLLNSAFEPAEAEALATRALAMDPTSAWAWERRGFTRVSSGGVPQHAIDDFRRALRLRGPAMPQSNCFLGIADAHRAAGRREEAILWVRKAIAANPQATWLHRNRFLYAWEAGDRTEQVQAVDCLRRGIPELTASRVARAWPCPDWLDALVAAGMPLT